MLIKYRGHEFEKEKMRKWERMDREQERGEIFN